MLRSFLIGLTSGSRSITPLAVVSNAVQHGRVRTPDGKLAWLGHPIVATGLKTLAAGEDWGDKWKSAPDRIVLAGILARLVTGGLAGAALAPRKHVVLGAAVAAAYVTFGARMRAMRRFGQTPTGLVEDALTVAAAQGVVRVGRHRH